MLGAGQIDGPELEAAREALLAEARAALGASPARARVRHELRYRGQSFELPVDEEREAGAGLSGGELREAFAAAHEARYGYRDEHAEVELVNLRASVWGRPPELAPRPGGAGEVRRERAEIVFGGRRLGAEALLGEPEPGTALDGPALIALPESTLLVPPGWSAVGGCARHDRDDQTQPTRAMSLDPIELQVLTGGLRAACEEMGVVLIRSAHSSNIKERRDASTGLFDADGQMVMQAEHIPVHLGAMPAAVRAVLSERHAPGRLLDPQRPLRRAAPTFLTSP